MDANDIQAISEQQIRIYGVLLHKNTIHKSSDFYEVISRY